MIVLGLTGSLGMGKSTTAEMFAGAGCPVLSADAVVHDLYRGDAAAPIEDAFPGTVAAGVVDRDRLAAHLLANPADFARLEAIVHPLVRAAEEAFLAEARAAGAAVAVLDIPLLFETGAERRCDAVVVVTAPDDQQRARVLARPGMSEERLAAILGRQMPDAEKRRRADFVIDTGRGIEPARQAVHEVLAALARPDSGG
ncbi:MAG TPA: dephospho-CoA kinase [Hyphomicrobiales bacterium]|nr:dephospho-CoA kinase [Hyphomicrobiales bacterium]